MHKRHATILASYYKQRGDITKSHKFLIATPKPNNKKEKTEKYLYMFTDFKVKTALWNAIFLNFIYLKEVRFEEKKQKIT